MTTNEFRFHAHRLVDWMTDYLEQIEHYPVKSAVSPGEILNQLDDRPPEHGVPFEHILTDFISILIPGITHWQSPNFMAFFPSNSSPPSVLAEMLTATLAAQCMKWETSPAATELEERVLDWLRDAMGLPYHWSGVIQDTASTATLTALVCAREKYTQHSINQNGWHDQPRLRIYCSSQTHSSIEKGAKVAGFGATNVINIPCDHELRMQPEALANRIEQDIEDGFLPCCTVATLGTTGTTAIDPLSEIAQICRSHKVWLHVDASYAGSLLLLDEYRWMINGIEYANSFVFNPHKWLFTNFDCSIFYVEDVQNLISTFAIRPEYLKSSTDHRVTNYSDWGIPLGRRFRALKLWFVLRTYGLSQLKNILRTQITMTIWLEEQIIATDNYHLLSPRTMNLLCFHYRPIHSEQDPSYINHINRQALDTINASGKLYITHTQVNDWFGIRVVVGQLNTSQQHVELAWMLIQDSFNKLQDSFST